MATTTIKPTSTILDRYILNIGKILPAIFFIFGIALTSSITLIDIIKVIIFIIYLPIAIFKWKEFKNNIIAILMLIFTFLFVLSSIISTKTNINIMAIKLFVNIFLFPTGVMAITFHSKELKWLIYGLVLGSLIQFVLVLIQAIYNINFTITFSEIGVFPSTRPAGTVNTHSQYSSIAIIVSPLALIFPAIMSSTKHKRLIQVFSIVSSGLIFFGVVLSKTRGAMIGCLIGLLAFIILYIMAFKKNKIGLIILFGFFAMLVISFFVISFFLPSVSEKISTIITYNERAEGQCRMAIYEEAIRRITNSPIIGNGLYTLYYTKEGCSITYHCHNNYLEIVYGMGIFALLVILINDGIILVKSVKGTLNKNISNDKRLISIGIFSTYICFIVYGLSDLILFNATLTPLLFFGIGIISKIDLSRKYGDQSTLQEQQ